MTNAFLIYNDAATLHRLFDSRVSLQKLVHIPEGWKRKTGFAPGFRYTVDKPVVLTGAGTFDGCSAKIEILPSRSSLCHFTYKDQSLPAKLSNAKCDRHNISIGAVDITEHVLALFAALGFTAEFRLNCGSFPSFHRCLEPILDAIEPHLVRTGEFETVTVSEPFAAEFANGAYAIVYPDDGSNNLVLDHEFRHPRNILGEQRIRYTVEPDSFGYLARAQPMSYGWHAQALGLFQALRFSRIPFTGFVPKNFVLVGKNKLQHAHADFRLSAVSIEPIVHELIDKLGALALIGKRFAGTVVTSRTSHSQDVQWAQILVEHLV